MKYRSSTFTKFFSIMICSTIVGAGVGFLTGIIAPTTLGMEVQIIVAPIAAIFGAVGDATIGVIIFTVDIYRKIDFLQFSILTSASLLVACASSFILNSIHIQGSWWIAVLIPMVFAVSGTIYLRFKNIVEISNDPEK
jgi:hypothetical protein